MGSCHVEHNLGPRFNSSYVGSIVGTLSTANGPVDMVSNSTQILLVDGAQAYAYDTNTQTRARGALPGSVVEAVDQTGQSALYFLDPAVGPCRLGVQGIEWCGYDVQKLWKRVEVDAAIPCHAAH